MSTKSPRRQSTKTAKTAKTAKPTLHPDVQGLYLLCETADCPQPMAYLSRRTLTTLLRSTREVVTQRQQCPTCGCLRLLGPDLRLSRERGAAVGGLPHAAGGNADVRAVPERPVVIVRPSRRRRPSASRG